MEAVLLVVHLIIALGIIVMVLIQPAESGGFLGSGGSMSNMMAPRRKGDVLTRMTGIFATCFFITSLLLAIIASHNPVRHDSILDADDTAAPVAIEQAVDANSAKEVPVENDAPATEDIPKAPISQ